MAGCCGWWSRYARYYPSLRLGVLASATYGSRVQVCGDVGVNDVERWKYMTVPVSSLAVP